MSRARITTFHKAKSMTTTGLIIAVALSVSGCSGEPSKTTSPISESRTSSSSHTKPAATTPAPSPTSTAFTLKAESIDKSCEQVLNLQSLYDFDPNLALTPDSKATLGTIGPQQKALGAVSCLLTNLSSQEETQVVVTELDSVSTNVQSESIATPASGSQSYQVASGVPGVFSLAGGIGTAQFMSGNYWVSLTSRSLSSGVQASPLSFLVWNNLN